MSQRSQQEAIKFWEDMVVKIQNGEQANLRTEFRFGESYTKQEKLDYCLDKINDIKTNGIELHYKNGREEI